MPQCKLRSLSEVSGIFHFNQTCFLSDAAVSSLYEFVTACRSSVLRRHKETSKFASHVRIFTIQWPCYHSPVALIHCPRLQEKQKPTAQANDPLDGTPTPAMSRKERVVTSIYSLYTTFLLLAKDLSVQFAQAGPEIEPPYLSCFRPRWNSIRPPR